MENYYRDNVVHKLSNGKFVVARWGENENQWIAPMTAAEQHITGGREYFARDPQYLGCHQFTDRQVAIRFAQNYYPQAVTEQEARESA